MVLNNFGVIIFCNSDLTPGVEGPLQRQLQISDTIDGYEFAQRLLKDPNYLTEVHLQGIRLLVIQSAFDLTNHNLADIVIFIKAGLAYIESNKYGPPGQTFVVDRMRLEQLISAETMAQNALNIQNNIQSNILYPMFHPERPKLYPFGSDIRPSNNDGDFDNDDDD